MSIFNFVNKVTYNISTFAHFTYYPGNSLRLQIFLHDPNLQLYNTRSYLGFYIFYQYFHLHYLQFHIPNSAMAWQHQSSLLTFGFTITLMHRPTLWHCLKLGYYNKHKYNLLCHPITRPRHGRLLTALSSTLHRHCAGLRHIHIVNITTGGSLEKNSSIFHCVNTRNKWENRNTHPS